MEKVSNGFMFVLNIYFLFLLRFSSSRCILGQFLSQLGQLHQDSIYHVLSITESPLELQTLIQLANGSSPWCHVGASWLNILRPDQWSSPQCSLTYWMTLWKMCSHSNQISWSHLELSSFVPHIGHLVQQFFEISLRSLFLYLYYCCQ